MKLLVFDLGGTSVKYAVYDHSLKDQGSFKTPDTWDAMKRKFKQIHEELATRYDFEGVALSAPGSVNTETGVIGGISAIPYIHNFKIVEELESLFSLPVSIENDANSAALAELWKGEAKDLNHVLFVVIGTGIGGAVIQDGKLMKGHNLFGGEFGIMLLDGKESFSMLGTAVHMAERYCRKKGVPDDHYSGEEVFNFAENGDEVAVEEVNKFYDALSLGLYNLQFTTDPEAIILGGGVSQYKPLIPNLTKRIDQRLKEAGLEDVSYKIKACKYLNDANLVGAVYAHKIQKQVDIK